jgi:hypothetical protein
MIATCLHWAAESRDDRFRRGNRGCLFGWELLNLCRLQLGVGDLVGIG